MIKTIGIIGGSGQMGRMFETAFRSIGKRVLISDVNTITAEEQLVRESDLIIVSVPIDETPDVIRRIKPWLVAAQLLTDFSSVKDQVIPALLETPAALISCHPMFGRMPNMIQQNIVLLPIRPGDYLSEYQNLYQQIGLNVVVLEDWRQHDAYMSLIQGLMHFFHLVFTRTLSQKKADLATLLSICSPVYQANFAFACRILQRDPHLYTHILMDNPQNAAVIEQFIDQARQTLSLIERKDEISLKRLFSESRRYLGKFASVFSAQSDYLINKIKDYS